MVHQLIKIGMLGLVATVSMEISSQVINEMVIEINSKEKTITDVIIQQQVEVALEEAEQKIEQVMEEESIVIEVVEVEMKPPIPEPEPEIEEVQENTEAVIESEIEETLLEEVAEVEEMDSESGTLEDIDLSRYNELSEEDFEYIGNYLIDNYFLYGYTYYTNETNPVLKERKKLANDMEVYVIESLQEVFGVITDLTSLDSEMLSTMKERAQHLSQEFVATYSGIAEQESDYKEIYDEALSYFDIYIDVVSKAETTFKTIEESSNKLLILPMMLNSINEDILPGVAQILDQGFVFKAKTNAIYLEGVDGSFLLDPQQVIEIILDPSKILGEAQSQESGEELLEVEEESKEEIPEVEENEEEIPEVEENEEEIPEVEEESEEEIPEVEEESEEEIPEVEEESEEEIPEVEEESEEEIPEVEEESEEEIPEVEEESEEKLPEVEEENEEELPEVEEENEEELPEVEEESEEEIPEVEEESEEEIPEVEEESEEEIPEVEEESGEELLEVEEEREEELPKVEEESEKE